MADNFCRSCLGSGEWEAECCNGAGGCSCRGRAVQMGRCNACGGTGRADGPGYDPMANVNAIRGFGFLGTGPRMTGGVFDSLPRYGASPVPAGPVEEQ